LAIAALLGPLIQLASEPPQAAEILNRPAQQRDHLDCDLRASG
jgi:hypothetical protein